MFGASATSRNNILSEKNESLPPTGAEINEMFHFLTELRENGHFCDVTLKLDTGEQFRAHRTVLSFSSPFLRALFTNSSNFNFNGQGDQKIVPIPGVPFSVMKLILEHCYMRRCNIDESNVETLLPIADRLFITSLKQRCCDFLANQLENQNCIGIWRFARFYFCEDLANRAYRFLLKNFLNISTTCEEWLQLNEEELKEICRDDFLNCKSEDQVFSAIYRWLAFDASRQKSEKLIADLFQTVRLDLLPLPFIREIIERNCLVKGNASSLALYSASYRKRLNVNSAKNSCLVDVDVSYFSRLRIPHEVLIAIGGWSGRQPNDIIEAYDVRANRWRVLNVKLDQGPRAYHGCVTLNGHELYILGGYDGVDYFNSVRKWNLVTGTWKEAAPMNYRRCYVASVVLNGAIFVFGGFDGQVRTNTAERYDPSTNQWSFITPMNFQRSDAGAVVLNGHVFVCGGFNGHHCLNTVEEYDPVTKRWTNVAPMTTRRSGVSAIVYHGSLYVLGGFNGRNRIETVERYLPGENVWRPVGSMKTPRSNFGVGVIDDQLFAIGGFHSGETMADVETYTNSTNQWTDAAPMNRNRSALSAIVVTDLPNIEKYLRRDESDASDDGYVTDEETDDEEEQSENEQNQAEN